MIFFIGKNTGGGGDFRNYLSPVVLSIFSLFASTTPLPGISDSSTPAAPAQQHSEEAASTPQITYVSGQLTINALDIRLDELLTKVGALTGVKIDFPDGVKNEMLPVVKLGPAPARDILASLLTDNKFDYLIQESDTDPDKLQSVLVLARRGKAELQMAAGEAPPPSTVRRAYPPIESPSEKPSESRDVTPPASPEPAGPAIANSPTQPVQTSVADIRQTATSDLAHPAALNPAEMNSNNISQKLQQMYQQRMQMGQLPTFNK